MDTESCRTSCVWRSTRNSNSCRAKRRSPTRRKLANLAWRCLDNAGAVVRLPQKQGKGGYFVDWVLAKLDAQGELVEFVAVEVQTIDTTGTYRNGYEALVRDRSIVKTTAGLNWENVSKRILPQLIYKGQVLQRESLCKRAVFVCPQPVVDRVMDRLGGQAGLVKYALQPASITFLAYSHDETRNAASGF